MKSVFTEINKEPYFILNSILITLQFKNLHPNNNEKYLYNSISKPNFLNKDNDVFFSEVVVLQS